MIPDLPPLKEAEFQRMVIGLAHLSGWVCAHFRPALTRKGRWMTAVQADGAGFVDLVLVRPPRLVFAELKSDRGKTSPAQDAWLEALRQTPAEVYLWRPSMWHEITRILA